MPFQIANGLQRDLNKLAERETYDVIVVGAGPAGATAAAHLADHHSVILLDKAFFPRDKTCGDCLLPDAHRCLKNLGMLEKVQQCGQAISSVSAYSPSQARVDITGNFLTIRRKRLDALIAERAVRAGAMFYQGAVENIKTEGDEVSVSISGKNILLRARVCLLATGANLALANKVGIVKNHKASAVALRCYVKSAALIDRLIICYIGKILPGYGWIFPMGNKEFNIGCVILESNGSRNLHEIFNRFTSTFPLAKDVMRRSSDISPIKGAVIRGGFDGVRAMMNKNVLGLGECVSTTLPFTGEGIGKAMQSGEIAAESVHQYLTTEEKNHLDEYPRLLKSRLGPIYQEYSRSGQWLAVPWLNELVIRRARQSVFLRKTITAILDEQTLPRAVFSLKGIVRSFFC